MFGNLGISRKAVAGIAVLLSLASAVALAGCGGQAEEVQVAAVVDGVPIEEQVVTDEIAHFRYMAYVEDDEAWQRYLSSSGTDPEEVRGDVIDTVIEDHLIGLYAGSIGVSVGDDEIQVRVDDDVEASDYDDELSYAESIGYSSVGNYRRYIGADLYRSALVEHFREVARADGDDYIGAVSTYASMIDGARLVEAACIPIADIDDREGVDAAVAECRDIHDDVVSGAIAFDEAIELLNGRYPDFSVYQGEIGWDTMLGLSDAQMESIRSLNIGDIGEPIVDDRLDLVAFFRVADIYHLPGDFMDGDTSALGSIDELPEAFGELISNIVDETVIYDEADAWIGELVDAADIVVNDMPYGLPYDIPGISDTIAASETDGTAGNGGGSGAGKDMEDSGDEGNVASDADGTPDAEAVEDVGSGAGASEPGGSGGGGDTGGTGTAAGTDSDTNLSEG